MHACSVAQSSPTLCDPMDCSPPVSSVHGIFQARLLERVALSFSRGFSQPRNLTQVSCIGRQILYHWATWEALHSHGRIVFPIFPIACLIISSGFRIWGKHRKFPRSAGKEFLHENPTSSLAIQKQWPQWITVSFWHPHHLADSWGSNINPPAT